MFDLVVEPATTACPESREDRHWNAAPIGADEEHRSRLAWWRCHVGYVCPRHPECAKHVADDQVRSVVIQPHCKRSDRSRYKYRTRHSEPEPGGSRCVVPRRPHPNGHERTGDVQAPRARTVEALSLRAIIRHAWSPPRSTLTRRVSEQGHDTTPAHITHAHARYGAHQTEPNRQSRAGIKQQPRSGSGLRRGRLIRGQVRQLRSSEAGEGGPAAAQLQRLSTKGVGFTAPPPPGWYSKWRCGTV